ncbi:MFS transporter [Paenibacillus macquariensis]|uniref:Predicted arabinose efflux permease, MFS family n=1 Tax=Paenibacillus macquariensis TaxID=948756 RepID=A0ABY1K8R4_9BACL|nr:MFS transporter [Paenibacillus macquariensis]MEC0093320.1 MFS transporter [Paenibacillus macquariensis]OAB27523.1 MFS transporter [Paenibacillus macquariensis subsp. macquariensis]SIR41873.1 Predicted arabinose efflux permease, MFS family [Paenibacillus macquariensis]
MRYLHQVKKGWNDLSLNIKLFFLANVLFQIGGGMFSVLYNLYIQDLGYEDAMTGKVVGIQSLATALMFIPVGLLGDRTSRKKLLIIGAMFSGLAFIGRSFFDSEFSLLSLAVVSGLFASIFQVLAIPFLAESIPMKQRLRIFSYYSSLVLASQVLGSMGGGMLADLFQTFGMSRISSLQIVLAVGGVATFAAFIPLLFIIEATRKVKSKENLATTIDQPLKTVSRNLKSDYTMIGQFALVQLIIGIGSGLVIPYLNLYFTNRFTVSLSAVGLLISLGQIMTIVSMLIGPSLAAKVGSVKAVVCFQLLSLPFLLITGFTNLFAIAAVSFLFRQALMNAANPIQSSVLIDRVSDSSRGIANSITQTAFMLGWAFMGPIQSYFVTTYGYYWGYAVTFSITGVLYVSAAALYYTMFRKPRLQPNTDTLLTD